MVNMEGLSYTPVKIQDVKSTQTLPIIRTNRLKSESWTCTARHCGIAVLSLIAAFAGLGALTVWKTGFLDNMITNQLVIVNETKVYDMWSRPPVHPLHYIYLFNYTNVDEFREGRADKLKVEEIGPYVYRQTLRKVNVQFHHENGTVSFQRHSTFHYEPKLSVGNLKDIVIAPNLVLLGAVNELLTRNYLMQVGLSMIVQNLAPTAFLTLPVEEFLWGYEDSLFDMAKSLGGLNNKEVPFDQMALMAGRNGTQPQILSVYTGVTDISQLDVMAEFNGLTELNIWEGKCNEISGSEGTMFPPPVVQAGEDISVYSPEMCRKIPLKFDKAVKTQGLPAMRFVPDSKMFDNAEGNCYCHGKECPLPGVFDATKCNDAPVFVSFPHFFRGSEELHKYIDGLSPNASLHEFYMDIHDRFGVILGGSSRMQANILARKTNTYPQMSMFKEDTILPTAWFEVIVDDLPEDVKNDLQLATHTATHAVMYFLLVTFVVSSTILACLVTRRTKSPHKLQYMKDAVIVAPLQEAIPCKV